MPSVECIFCSGSLLTSWWLTEWQATLKAIIVSPKLIGDIIDVYVEGRALNPVLKHAE